jgi:viroplasmin and RNaseH domain-containing protein
MKFYGVRRGRSTGVFESWEACRQQVFKFPDAEYKAFPTWEEASAFATCTASTTKNISETSQDSPSAPLSRVAIWVDGSCFPQGDGSMRIGWGLLVKQDGREVYRAKGNDIPPEAHRHRNVAGEIFGILKSLEWCKAHGITEVTLYFDYQGLESWATGSWRTKLPFTQSYARAVKASGITIHWIKIKAHSGNQENEIVDRLAKEGAGLELENEKV